MHSHLCTTFFVGYSVLTKKRFSDFCEGLVCYGFSCNIILEQEGTMNMSNKTKWEKQFLLFVEFTFLLENTCSAFLMRIGVIWARNQQVFVWEKEKFKLQNALINFSRVSEISC